jgi:DNA mismatch repair protein MutL
VDSRLAPPPRFESLASAMPDPSSALPRAPIRRLEPDWIARIAAGEVVERPASVVKELLENALDAGARHISVRVDGGGIDRVEVADDGPGIPAEELELAVERHATSKLDPTRGWEAIRTLGFRGEALAAIGAVARLTIVSRPADQDEAHGLAVDAGRVTGRFVAARSPGTTVDVRDLFHATPARRKFLRAPAAEKLEAIAAVERLYLARPSATVLVSSDGSEVGRYPAADSLLDAAARVFGPEFLAQAVDVVADGPGGIRVTGAVARPALSRATADGILFAVNDRPAVSRRLTQAVRQAYRDYLPRTRFPVGILHVSLDPARVDPNVHPTKREVRVIRESEVEDTVRLAVRRGLLAAPQVADRAASREPRPVVPSVPVDLGGGPGAVFSRPTGSGGSGRREPLTPRPPPVELAGTPRHPRLELLGCLFRLYWVAAGDDESFVLIDQHAASERVLYDRLRAEGRLGRQELLEAVRLDLTSRQRATIDAHAGALRESGYTLEAFGAESVRVLAVPEFRGRRAVADRLPGLLDELADGGRPTVPDGLVERTAATIACHAAIRAGDAVDANEMARVLDALRGLADAAYACPHGRPIAVRTPRSRLDRWFLRSGA